MDSPPAHSPADYIKSLLQAGLEGPPPAFEPVPGLPSSSGAALWTPPAPEDVQEMVPELKVESLSGRGGMGAVYRCYDPILGRPVALKIPSPALADDPETRQRFLREGKAMASLRHPHILTVYRSISAGANPALVMEFVEGTDLAHLIRRSAAARAGGMSDPLPLAEALRIFAEVCSAVDYAHREGVLHRDLKPANILLDAALSPRVADFGLARPVTVDEAFKSRADRVAGSLAYMAPEQLRGQEVGRHTDIFALGIMLHEILTGEVPGGRPVHDVRPGVPRPLGGIIAKAIAQHPASRWKSAAELEREIRRLLTKLKEPAWRRWTRRATIAGAAAAGIAAIAASVLQPPAPPARPKPVQLADPPGTRTSFQGQKFVPVAGMPHLFAGMWEIRVQDFAAFIKETGYRPADQIKPERQEFLTPPVLYSWNAPGREQSPDHPVTCISWRDADAYCQWLTQTARAKGEIQAPAEYRLLTDAEWSAVAGVPADAGDWLWERPVEQYLFTWGKTLAKPPGWENHAETEKSPSPDGYQDIWKAAAPVGSLKRTAAGFHDLGGNVREWILDTFDFSDLRHAARSTGFRGRPNISQYSLSRRSDCWRDGGNDTLGLRIILDLKSPDSRTLAIQVEKAVLAWHNGTLPPPGARARGWITGAGVTLDLSAGKAAGNPAVFAGIPVRELITGPELASADFTPLASPALKRLYVSGGWPHLPALAQLSLEYLTIDGGGETASAGAAQLPGLNVTHLRGLCIRDAPAFHDLSPLRAAANLRALRLIRTGVSNLSPIAGLQLDELDATGSPLTVEQFAQVPQAERLVFNESSLASFWDLVHQGKMREASTLLSEMAAKAQGCQWFSDPAWQAGVTIAKQIAATAGIDSAVKWKVTGTGKPGLALQFGGNCYALLPGRYATNEAWWLATVLRAHPVAVNSPEEWTWLADTSARLSPALPSSHLGCTRREDGSWQWCTGEPWEYSRWLNEAAANSSDRAYFSGDNWAGVWNCPPREQWRQPSLKDSSFAPLIVEWESNPGKLPATALVQALSRTWTSPEGESLQLHPDGRVNTHSIARAWWCPLDPGAGQALVWLDAGLRCLRISPGKDASQLLCHSGNLPAVIYHLTAAP